MNTAQKLNLYKDYLIKSGVSPASVERKLSSLRAYFAFVEHKQSLTLISKKSEISVPVSAPIFDNENFIEKLASLGIKAEATMASPISQKTEYFKNISSSYSRLVSKIKKARYTIPYSLKYSQPKWFISYQKKSISRFINYGILLIICVSLGIGGYEQFIKRTQKEGQVLGAVPVKPPTVLSFQGRLTDAAGTPITSSKTFTFNLYNVGTGGTALWTESKSISPDTDGIFNTYVGDSAPIDQTIFRDNTNVYLGVAISPDSEMTSRQQVATVGYAFNSQYLQGYDVGSTGAQVNQIPVVNSNGNIVIAASSPALQSTTGSFKIIGAEVYITSTGGNINLDPNALGAGGSGNINLTSSIVNGNVINATSSALRSGALIYGNVGNTAPNIKLIQLQVGNTASDAFFVDVGGSGFFSGNLGIGITRPSYKLEVNGGGKFSGGVNVGAGLSVSNGVTFSGLSTGTGTTALFTDVNGNLTTRVLGTNAFNSNTYDNYVSWSLLTNGLGTTAILSGNSVNLVNGVGISMSQSGSTITINNTGTGTTYSANNGITLSGSNFFGLGGTLSSLTKIDQNSNNFSFFGTGNVGIGTTNQAQKLDVNGSVNVGGSLTLGTMLYVGTGASVSGDVSINGGDLTSNQTTFRLLDNTVTTLNVGGAATTIELGAATGVLSINTGASVDGTLYAVSNLRVGTSANVTGNLNVGGTFRVNNSSFVLDNGGNITTGTWKGTAVGTSYGGTGLTTTATSGQLLIGNNNGYTLATITAGTGIGITNGVGSITINNLGTGTTYSANNGLTMASNWVQLGGTLIQLTKIDQNSNNFGFWGTGNVGIGNTNPAQKLDVTGGLNVSTSATFGTNITVGGSASIVGMAAHTLTGAITGNGQNITGLGTITGTSASMTGAIAAGNYAFIVDSTGNVTAGTWKGTAVGTSYGGTGLTTTATSGQLLIGNNNGYTLATITAGTGIGITNGVGSITINNLGTGTTYSANNGLTMASNWVQLGGTLIQLTKIDQNSNNFGFWGTGNVGIGNTNPAQKLDVTGGLNVSTSATFGTNITVGGSASIVGMAAHTLTGAITGNGQNITGLGTITGTSASMTGAIAAGNYAFIVDSTGNVTAGTWKGTAVGTSYGGTGLTTTATSGQLLIGNNNGYTLATITAGTGIGITNGVGSITINNLGTGTTYSANNGLTMASNWVQLGGTLIQLTKIDQNSNNFGFWGTGNVGIGNTNPTQKLDVTGGLNVSTSATFGTNITVGGSASIVGMAAHTLTGAITGNGQNITGLGTITGTSASMTGAIAAGNYAFIVDSTGNVTAGTWKGTAVGTSYGGTGLTTTATSGQLLIGNNNGYTLATITAGTGIGITNGVGSITINNLGTGTTYSANNGLTMASNWVQLGGTLIQLTKIDQNSNNFGFWGTGNVGIGNTNPAQKLDVTGGLNVSTSASIGTMLYVGTGASIAGDVSVNGGDLSSNQTTFRLLDNTVTTLNVGGAATAIELGAATGVLSINTGASVDGTLYAVSNLRVGTSANVTGNLNVGGTFRVNNSSFVLDNGGNITTGTWKGTAVGTSYGGTGLTTTATSGQLLIGNNNGYTLGTISVGNSLTVTNGAGTISISHADTSSQTNSDNSNGVVIQDIGLDGLGHLTSLATVDLDSRYLQSANVNWVLKGDSGTPETVGIGNTAFIVGGSGMASVVSATDTLTLNVGAGNGITVGADSVAVDQTYAFNWTGAQSWSQPGIFYGNLSVIGNVGIGTTATQKLDVNGSVNVGGSLTTGTAITVGTNLYTVGSVNVGSSAQIGTNLLVGSSANINGALTTTGAITAPTSTNTINGLVIDATGSVTTGTWKATAVGTSYGGTGLTTTATSGQLLIGNNNGYTLATITAGTGIGITNGVGSITINNLGSGTTYTANNGITLASGNTFQWGGQLSQLTKIDQNSNNIGFWGTGNVGIGNTNPAQKLDVTGGLNVSTSASIGTMLYVGTGASIAGDVSVNGGDLSSNQTTFRLLDNTVTTLNVGGAATTIELGAATGITSINNGASVDLSLSVNGGNITTNDTSFNLLNGTATTINFGGAATLMELGAATGVLSINTGASVDGTLYAVSNLRVGTSANIATNLNVGGTFSVGSNVFVLNGSGDVTTGTWKGTAVGTSYGGTGLTTTATSGQLLIGNNNGYTLGTISVGNSLTVTNGAGTISISHADTSSQTNSDNSNGVVIQDIGLDGLGHLTSLATVDLDSRYLQSANVNWVLKGDSGTPETVGIGNTAFIVGGSGMASVVSATDTLTLNVGAGNGITVGADSVAVDQTYAFNWTGAQSWSQPGIFYGNLSVIGNVGIGTTATQKLDVNGSVNVGGSLTTGTAITVGTNLYTVGSVNVGSSAQIGTNLLVGSSANINGALTTTGAITAPTATNTINGLVIDGSGVITTGTWNGTTVGVSYGGTGSNIAMNAGAMIYASSNTAMAASAVGTSNQILASSGSGAPVWLNQSSITGTTYSANNGLTMASNWVQLGGTLIQLTKIDQNSNNFSFFGTGNVGIGTTNQAQKLDVNGSVNVGGSLTLGTMLYVGTGASVSGDVSINGGDLTSNQTTFRLLDNTVTTLNVGGAATAIELGAATGVLSINTGASVDGTLYAVSNLRVGTSANVTGNLNVGGTFRVNNSSFVLDNGGNITTGTWKGTAVGTSYGGTGLTTTATSGQLLIGNNNGYTLGTISVGNSLTVTNGAGTISISHADTSSQTNSDNSNGVVIQDIGLDGLGHLTSLATVDLDSRYLQSANVNWVLKGDSGTPETVGIGNTAFIVGGSGMASVVSATDTLTLNVGAGNGITVGADSVAVDQTYAFNWTGAQSWSQPGIFYGNLSVIGNVGIGTTATQKLDVNGSVNVGGSLTTGTAITVGTNLYTVGSVNVGSSAQIGTNLLVGSSANINGALTTTGAITAPTSTNTINGLVIDATGSVTTGTWKATAVGTSYGGTGLTTTATSGQLLIGNNNGYTLATITAGTGIGITNGVGSITINNLGSGTTYTANNGITLASGNTFQWGGQLSQLTKIDQNSNNIGFWGTGNVGIGNTNPAQKLDVTGGLNVSTSASIGTMLYVGTGASIAGDVSVNGGDLSSNQTTFRLLDNTVTTLNVGGAATTIELGAATGITSINNGASVDLSLSVNGGNITTNDTSFNLLNGTATTINFGGAATLMELGAATGLVSINNGLSVDGNMYLVGALNVGSSVRIGTNLLVGSSANINGALTTTGAITAPTATNTINTMVIDATGSVTTGTWKGTAVGTSYGGTGLTTTATSGQLLIGNNNGYTLATITAGTGIGITNAAGSITINAIGTSTGTTYSANNGLTMASNWVQLGGTLIQLTKIDQNSNNIGFWGTGNVGIGNTNPAQKLDVTGGLNVSTSATFGTNITVGGTASITGMAAHTLTGAITGNGQNITGLGTITGTSASMTGAIAAGNYAFIVDSTGNVTAGTWKATAVGTSYGGTGLTTTATSGQLLIGNNNGYTLATITAGTGIGITNGVGSITINAIGTATGTTYSANNGLTMASNWVQLGGTLIQLTKIDQNSNNFSFFGTGNVGIGTTNQAQKLDVNGSVNVGGSLTLGTMLYVGTGASVTGDVSVNGGDLSSNQTTFRLLDNTVTTLNVGGAATAIELGAATGITSINNGASVDLSLSVNGGNITTNDTSFNLLNGTATTINFGGAATLMELGAATGLVSINNGLSVDGNMYLVGALNVGSSVRIGTNLLVGSSANINGALTTTGAITAPTATNTINTMVIDATGSVTTGTWKATAVGTSYGGTGLTTTATSGQLLIGNNNGYTLATITAGTGIGITNASGSITINALGGTGTGTTYSANNGITKTGSNFFQLGGTLSQLTTIDMNSNNFGFWNTGSFGIGTTNPGTGGKLHVASALTREGIPSSAVFSDTTDTTKGVFIGFNSTDDYGLIAASDDGAGWKNLSLNPLGGYVGIGTTSPSQVLEIKSTAHGSLLKLNSTVSNPTIQFAGPSDSYFLQWDNVNGFFGFQNSGGLNEMVIKTGNVGIGTTSPAFKLDVNGIINTNSNLEVGTVINSPYGGIGRYQNQIGQSEAFDTSWNTSGTLTVTPNSTTAPNGETTADTLTAGTAAAYIYWNTGIGVSAQTFTYSVWAKTSSGTQNFHMGIAECGYDAGGYSLYTATTTWQRFTFTRSSWGNGAGTACPIIFPGTASGTGTIIAWGAQNEQSVTTAGTYVKTTGTAISTASNGVVASSSTGKSLLYGNVGIGYVDPGTAALAINGNVGIGTTIPNSKLTITTPISYTGNLLGFKSLAEPDAYNMLIRADSVSGVVRYVFDMTNGATPYNNVLTLDRGNVGIGTSSPTQLLDVNGSINVGGSITTGTTLTVGTNLYTTGSVKVGTSAQIGTNLLVGSSANINGALRTTGAITAPTATNTINTMVIDATGSVTTGTWKGTAVGTSYGGTGLTTTATSGQLLIGNNNGYTLATITAGTGIGITNGVGTITINALGSSGTGTTYSANNGLTMASNWVQLGGTLIQLTKIDQNSNNFSFFGTGNVGIGTTNQAQKLDVNGGVNIGTSLTLGTMLYVGTGASIAGDVSVNGGDLSSNQTTFRLLDNTVTTLNVGGAATAIELGAATGITSINNGASVDLSLSVNGGNITTNDTSFNLLNGTATTINFGGAATLMELGAATGLVSINNGLSVDGNMYLVGALNVGSSVRIGTNLLVGSSANINGALTTTGAITAPTATNTINTMVIDATGSVTTGTWKGTAVAAQYGGTGINGATAANGTILIGNGSGYSLTTITAGTGIGITNASGSITINVLGSSSGTGTTYSAYNGLSLNPSNFFGLGGTLAQLTKIDLDGNNLGFIGTGNVGIGTADPAQKLDVNGSVNVGGSLTTGTALYVGTNLVVGTSANIATNLRVNGDLLVGVAGAGDLKLMNNQILNSAGNAMILFAGTGNLETRFSGGNVGVGVGTGTSGLFQVGIGGTPSFFIENTGTDGGNVGIGTTTPAVDTNASRFFTVSGDASKNGEISVGRIQSATNALVGGFQIFNSSITAADKRIAAIWGATDSAANSGALVFYTYDAGTIGERMRIDHAGNVGIGTTSPRDALAVIGDISLEATSAGPRYLNWKRNSDGWLPVRIGQTYPGPSWQGTLLFDTNNGASATDVSTKMVILSTGNVGIGYTSPLQKLDVNGSINVAGSASLGTNLYFGGMGADTNLYRSQANVLKTDDNFAVGLGVSVSGTLNVGSSANIINNLLIASGNIGINTIPTQKLDVNGSVNVGGSLTLGTNAYITTALRVGNSANIVNNLLIHSGNIGIGAIPTQKLDVNGSVNVGGSLTLGTNAYITTALRVGNSANIINNLLIASGNIGIGTIPTQKLDVNGSVNVGGSLTLGTNAYVTTALRVGNSANIINNLLIASGNIGIGTIPTQKLDVNGSVRIGGSMTITDKIYVNTGSSTGNGGLVVLKGNLDFISGGSGFSINWMEVGGALATQSISRNAGSNVLSVNGGWSIAGNLSKGTGTFLIDSPLDPQNKVLRHSFVESPEMMNIYKGRAVTQNGVVTITLPDWFNALNGNNQSTFEYSFTPIKSFCKIAVKDEIRTNQFTVASDRDCAFSWIVYAVRHDRLALDHPVLPEESKSTAFELIGRAAGPCLWGPACNEPNINIGASTTESPLTGNLDFNSSNNIYGPEITALTTGLADLNLTSTGDLVLDASNAVYTGIPAADELRAQSSLFKVTKSADGQLVTRVLSGADGIFARIKSGLIDTTNLIAENIAVQRINTNEKIVSPLIEADKIKIGFLSPISGSDITIDLGSSASGFGKLLVQGNAEFSGNVGIGATLQAKDIISENLTTKDATITGELVVESARIKKLRAESIVGLEAYFASMSAVNVSTQNISGLEATPSADLSDLSVLRELLASASAWTTVDPSNDVKIQSNVSILGVTTLAQTVVAGTLTQDGTLAIEDGNSINVIGGTLYLQNKATGGIDLLAGKVTIDQFGNAIFNGDLTVKGNLYAEVIKASTKDITFDLNTPNSTESAFGKLIAMGADGKEAFSVDASGSATMAALQIQRPTQTPEPNIDGTVSATSSAGVTEIASGTKEVTIKSPFISEKSLVYLTPIGSTNNQVLYIKEVNSIDRSFTIAVDQVATNNLKFNWWIIN